MSGFHIHSGNRLENLAEVLAGLLCEPDQAGILEPEVVVVPSRGLERWLNLYLARVNGISANLEFPFPQGFLEREIFSGLRRQLDPQLDPQQGGDPFAKELLVWRLFFALGASAGASSGSKSLSGAVPDRVAHYLEMTGDELSRFQLARELGDLFDRYLLFRPELIRAWERGENLLPQFEAARWQMELWRDLGKGLVKTHFAALQEQVNQLLYPEFFPDSSGLSLELLREKLPRRIFLFGFAALPFNYLDLFKALSRLVEVHFFHINPCAEFWGDQFDLRAGSRGNSLDGDGDGGGKKTGVNRSAAHPLLASWGRLGRAFFDLVASLEVDSYREYFTAPENDSLLAKIQRQILFLERPDRPEICLVSDNSIIVNLCHGPQREVEILYDTILAALDADPKLMPEDIFVMAPDIDLYAPYIEALFALRRSHRGEIDLDYTIVSARTVLELPEIRAFFALLRIFESRFLLREVFDLFSQEVVREKFSVSESDLDLLSNWLQKAGVSWGLDGEFRQDLSAVAFAENSLKWGLDRLLLGYGLAGSELYDSGAASGVLWTDESGSDCLPLAGIEGSEALVLGSFISFVSALGKAHKCFSTQLAAERWPSELKRLQAEFIKPLSESSPGRLYLRQAFANLEKQLLDADGPAAGNRLEDDLSAGSSAGRLISRATIVAVLEQELSAVGSSSGFFRGGLTFASILPLRAISARMICLLGLNDGDFPRSQRPQAFDLVAAKPQAGDRNARDEDRYLFLETLLAARERLVLSFSGRDAKDNHLRPPSVLVSELLDYIEDNFVPAAESKAKSMSAFLVRDHPPQPFSADYFEDAASPKGGPELFSYSSLQAEVANTIRGAGRNAPVFMEKPLSEVECERVEAGDLLRFFNNPAQYFLQERLKIDPAIGNLEQFAESEPFVLDALANYKFNDELVEAFLDLRAGEDSSSEADMVAELERRFTASGMLPPLVPGRAAFSKRVKGAQALAAKLRPYCWHLLPDSRKEVVLPSVGGEVELSVTLTNLFVGEDGILRQVFYRPAAEVKKKDRLKTAMMNIFLEISAPNLDLSGSFSGSISGMVGESCLTPRESCFFTLSEKESLVLPVRAAAAAQAEFMELLDVFQAGLTLPLPFLPDLSLLWYDEWLKKSAKNGDASGKIQARDKVRSELSNVNNYAARNEAFRFLFADRFADDDFWDEFELLALRLGPIFSATAGK